MTMLLYPQCIKLFPGNSTRLWCISIRHWYHVSRPCYGNQRMAFGRFSTDLSKAPLQHTVLYHRKCNKLLRPVCYQYQCKLWTSSDTAPEFTEVYRFKYIIQARLISRFKIYQTIITALSVPVCSYLYINGTFPLSGCVTIYSVAALAFVMLYYMSRYIQRIVGRIAIDKSQTTVKLSHLTFWGKKKDAYLEVQNIIPFSDMTGEEFSRGILHVKTYQNTNHHYILFVGKYGGDIKDENNFVTIFGKIK